MDIWLNYFWKFFVNVFTGDFKWVWVQKHVQAWDKTNSMTELNSNSNFEFPAFFIAQDNLKKVFFS